MQFDGFLRTDTRNRVSGPVGVASKRVEAPSTQEKPTSSMSANHPPSALIGAPPDPKSSPTCPIDTCPPPSDHGVPSEPIAAVVPTGDRASEAPKINENTNNDKKRSQPPRAAAVRYKKKNESAPGHPDRLSTEETVVMTTDQNNSTELLEHRCRRPHLAASSAIATQRRRPTRGPPTNHALGL